MRMECLESHSPLSGSLRPISDRTSANDTEGPSLDFFIPVSSTLAADSSTSLRVSLCQLFEVDPRYLSTPSSFLGVEMFNHAV